MNSRKLAVFVGMLTILTTISMSASASKEIYNGTYSCEVYSSYLSLITNNGRIDGSLTNKVTDTQVSIKNGNVSITTFIDGTPMSYRVYMTNTLSMNDESYSLRNNTTPNNQSGFITTAKFQLKNANEFFTIRLRDEYFETHSRLITELSLTLLCGTKK